MFCFGFGFRLVYGQKFVNRNLFCFFDNVLNQRFVYGFNVIYLLYDFILKYCIYDFILFNQGK